MTRILPLAVVPLAVLGLAASAGAQATRDAARAAEVRATVYALADDSLAGRRTGEPGAERAAAWLAARLEAMGVAPGGAYGYLQPVPLAAEGRRLRLVSGDELAALPADARRTAYNVVGIVPGTDPVLRGEAIIVGAHYDHVGTGRANADGDSIYNGADDDASGTAAVLEIARALADRPARRTVVFFLATGEEVGMLGTRRYLDDPAVPLDRTVAGLFLEMIGRPDPLAGGFGHAWLTGYDRSTVGEIVAAAGVPIVADPRPAQNFFERSDNTPFARQGVPAHALSSFNLHADYHTPDDEADRVDFAHLAAVVDAAVDAVRALADGPRPAWNPGGRPD